MLAGGDQSEIPFYLPNQIIIVLLPLNKNRLAASEGVAVEWEQSVGHVEFNVYQSLHRLHCYTSSANKPVSQSYSSILSNMSKDFSEKVESKIGHVF